MKKTIVFLLALICSGCGSKLTCTYKDSYEEIKIKNKIIFDFKDKSYEEIDIMIFNDNNSAKEYYKDISEYIEVYNLKLDGNKIISNLSGNISDTKNEIKNKYESYDFKCK